MGPIAYRELTMRFGGPGAVPLAGRDALAEFAGPRLANAILAGPAPAEFSRALEWMQAPAHRVVCIEEADYPAMLREIPDPPPALFVTGKLELAHGPCLAIVGSRNCSPQGALDARSFARALSDAGLCIVSGLALGIDAAAHEGGLAGKSSSIAVMGTGPETHYPRRNRVLASRLETAGCTITEFAPGTPPSPGNFPRRNRLISGLAKGVMVIEANTKSGSLVTAWSAAEQGREVFALPGSIHSTLSKGCHLLIKKGAALVETVDDVLFALRMGCTTQAPTPTDPMDRVDEADRLLRAMGFDAVSPDQIALRTGIAVSVVGMRLSRMQIEGAVAAMPGGRYQRVAGRA